VARLLPKELRKEIAAFARKLAKDYRPQFTSDPNLRKRAGQFLTALHPPESANFKPHRAVVAWLSQTASISSSSWLNASLLEAFRPCGAVRSGWA
jgi:hypothetical protein